MRVFLALLTLFSLLAFPQTKYKDKIWYVKPERDTQIEKQEYFILLSEKTLSNTLCTPYNYNFLMKNPDFIEINNIAFKTEFKGQNPKKLIPFAKGEESILIPYEKEFYALFKHKENKCFYIYRFDTRKNKAELIMQLGKEYFPGITVIDRAKEQWKKEPSFKKEMLNFIFSFSDFTKGWAFENKLILFNQPNYGMFFGRAIVIDLKTKKVVYSLEKIDRVFGVSKDFIIYSKFKDKDAGVPDNKLFVFTKGKENIIDNFDVKAKACINGNSVAYLKDKSLVVFNLKTGKKKTVTKIAFEKPVIAGISKTGNRVFLCEAKDNSKALYLYDNYLKKLVKVKKFKSHTPDSVYSSYDGEYNSFFCENAVYRLYLNDYSKPAIEVHFKNKLYNGKTYRKNLEVSLSGRDRCIVSGLISLTVNRKEYHKNHLQLSLPLKEGKNTLTFTAKDKAGNKTILRKTIYYQKPIILKIKDIDANPEKFKGKFVILEGYAWGWAQGGKTKETQKYSGLPFAKNNIALSRSDGSFSDGELRIFLPHYLKEGKKVKIIGIVKTRNGKWIFEPVEFLK